MINSEVGDAGFANPKNILRGCLKTDFPNSIFIDLQYRELDERAVI